MYMKSGNAFLKTALRNVTAAVSNSQFAILYEQNILFIFGNFIASVPVAPHEVSCLNQLLIIMKFYPRSSGSEIVLG